MAHNEVVTRETWPRLQSVFGEDFWPQLLSFGRSGFSLAEDDDHMYVEAAVPGLKPEDITLNFNQGTLTISGEHTVEKKTDRRLYRSMERKYSYQVSLPSQVKEGSEPDAELKSGVLSVTFEKAPEAKPRHIKIKAKAA